MKYPFFNLPDWNQTSPTQRTDLAQELSENLPNFEFTDIQLCEFGNDNLYDDFCNHLRRGYSLSE